MARTKGLSCHLAKMFGLIPFLLPERLFVLIARHSNQYSAAPPKEHSACLTPLSQWLAATKEWSPVTHHQQLPAAADFHWRSLSCTDSVLPHLSVELEHQRD